MKILLVNKFHYRRGGAETYYFTLAEGLKQAGHEVIFFSMKHPLNIECEQSKYFVDNSEYNDKTSIMKKIRMLHNFVYSKNAYQNMNQLLDDEKPDLVILNNIHRQITTSIVDAIFEHKIKIFWVVHDLISLCPNYTMLNGKNQICEKCSNGKYINCIKNKCVKNSYFKSYLAYKEARYSEKHKIYDKVDMFITPSKFYKNKLIEYGFNVNKVIHITNPLLDKETNIDEFDVNDYALFFGRLSSEKGIISLINSVRNTNIKLLILGTGPLENEIRNLVKTDLNKIVLGGFKTGDELDLFIKKSRCVVVPSEWYENCPYSAMEAMRLGKPLVVSNYGGLPELVEDGINGYIYSNKDELSNKIKKVFELDQNEYEKMSLEAKKIASNRFDLHTYVKRILNL